MFEPWLVQKLSKQTKLQFKKKSVCETDALNENGSHVYRISYFVENCYVSKKHFWHREMEKWVWETEWIHRYGEKIATVRTIQNNEKKKKIDIRIHNQTRNS